MRRTRPRTMEERVGGARLQHARRRRTRRTRRLAAGFGLVLGLSALTGVYLGRASHDSLEAVQAQAAEESAERPLDLSAEVNRTLLELWKMEELERQRGLGR